MTRSMAANVAKAAACPVADRGRYQRTLPEGRHYISPRPPTAFSGVVGRLFTSCLICQVPFDPNETLEHLPHGERVAYDPVRGRLWVICTRCRRWSLTPIEERWEALEELEKLVKDRA